MEETTKKLESVFKAEEILVGISNINPDNGFFELFLKADPRIIMDKLDEKFGPLGWKKETAIENIEGKPVIKCTIAVKADGEWISRDDHSGGAAWAESQEAKVMEADAFRRAAVQFGIGREFYTFKNICAKLQDDKGNDVLNIFQNQENLKWYSGDHLYVEQICYDENYNITALSIKNKTKGGIRICIDDRRDTVKQTTTFEAALNDARNTLADAAALTGRNIGSLNAEELYYVWSNTKTPEVKKACFVVAKHDEAAKKCFMEHGVKF